MIIDRDNVVNITLELMSIYVETGPHVFSAGCQLLESFTQNTKCKQVCMCVYIRHVMCVYISHVMCVYISHGICVYISHGICVYCVVLSHTHTIPDLEQP